MSAANLVGRPGPWGTWCGSPRWSRTGFCWLPVCCSGNDGAASMSRCPWRCCPCSWLQDLDCCRSSRWERCVRVQQLCLLLVHASVCSHARHEVQGAAPPMCTRTAIREYWSCPWCPCPNMQGKFVHSTLPKYGFVRNTLSKSVLFPAHSESAIWFVTH
jgi:hypothetical protein